MRIKTTGLFWAANLVLVSAGWAAALFAYPRLPAKIPLWFNFFGEQAFLQPKSPLFFIYAAGQTLFCLFFILSFRFLLNRPRKERKDQIPGPDKKVRTDPFGEEMALLALIFFNLVFIHIQTSLIYIAYKLEKGYNPYYFLMLFAVILLLIPYYRLRVRMYIKQERAF